MPHLFVDISAHGLGHLAQTAPILNALAHMLKRLPGRKIVFSNGPRHYAEAVLEIMGIRRLFIDVYAVELHRDSELFDRVDEVFFDSLGGTLERLIDDGNWRRIRVQCLSVSKLVRH